MYLSFDDDRLTGIQAEALDALHEEYYRRRPEYRGRRTVHWFLGEIQLVPGWERFVRRVLDTEDAVLVVSGSSARMLSREVHTSLRGRGVEAVIHPFSLREAPRHRGEEPKVEPELRTAAQRSRCEGGFRTYLVEGGFPEVQSLEPAMRVALLQGYVDTVLFRDVVERYGVTQVAALRWVVRQGMRNPGGLFGVHRLAQDLRAQGHGVAKDAVPAMLGPLLDAFLFQPLDLDTESERQRSSDPRKLYTNEPGLIRAFDTTGRSQLGHALETAVRNELERRRSEVAYLKLEGGQEIDFVARFADARTELIQVCADPSDPVTLGRELGAFEALPRRAYAAATKRLLVLTQAQARRIQAYGIEVEPAYEWILRGAAEGQRRSARRTRHRT